MNKVWDWYCELWYHTEFWMDKYARRPFTFCFHDWGHRHKTLCLALILTLVALFDYLAYLRIYLVVLGNLFCLLIGHIYWANWKTNEQEYPWYVE